MRSCSVDGASFHARLGFRESTPRIRRIGPGRWTRISGGPRAGAGLSEVRELMSDEAARSSADVSAEALLVGCRRADEPASLVSEEAALGELDEREIGEDHRDEDEEERD